MTKKAKLEAAAITRETEVTEHQESKPDTSDMYGMLRESMRAVDDAQRRHRFVSLFLEAFNLIQLEDIDYVASVLDKAKQELDLTRKAAE